MPNATDRPNSRAHKQLLRCKAGNPWPVLSNGIQSRLGNNSDLDEQQQQEQTVNHQSSNGPLWLAS
ncbi:hypothetical protein MMC14_003274 [Varicellaria rhodocarpa]|nr:hypothetical protein [Varicellaria rhodocarpa]